MNGSAWGGSEELWFRTALWMSRHHYKIGIGCYDWMEKQGQITELKNAGCTVYLLPNKKGLLNKAFAKKILHSIPLQEYNLTVISQGGWEEILHSTFSNLNKKIAVYVILNHNYNETAVLSFRKKKLLQKWSSGARMNFGATKKIFEVIENKFRITIDNKATLVNPITFNPEVNATPYPEFTNDTCKWVMLAELDTARKAQDVLITVLSSSKWKARNWQLHLFGKGKDKEQLDKLIIDLGLTDKVFLQGFTTNIKQTLLNCHLLLQCTRFDAMPLSVVEAMSMARPCVVSRVGDMPIWVEEGVNGFVCNEVSVPGLDEALEKSWQQKSLWETMGKNAFETFIKKYPQPYEEKTAEILNRFII